MKAKKALCLASMASNLDNFNRNNVKILKELGYDVTLASNFHTSEDINSQEKTDSFMNEMEAEGVHIVQIDFSRRIENAGNQIKSYKQVKELLKQGFDLIHCHAPICAAITRMCAKKYRKRGAKVIYTAHGFHFYDGAPLKNWVVFYPIEKWLSRYTDVLITINKEDYRRACEKFKAGKIVYVPGIGVDIEKFGAHCHGGEIREELGIGSDNTLLLSVGELNGNKNHEIVIRALAKLEEKPYYVIVGKGEKEAYLQSLITQLGLADRVKLAGFRNDVAVFYDAADAFVFPSFREGLSVALMEAMASGLPVVCGRIRGNTDLIDEGIGGFFFDPDDTDSVTYAIQRLLKADMKKYGSHNLERIKGFDVHTVEKCVFEIYSVERAV